MVVGATVVDVVVDVSSVVVGLGMVLVDDFAAAADVVVVEDSAVLEQALSTNTAATATASVDLQDCASIYEEWPAEAPIGQGVPFADFPKTGNSSIQRWLTSPSRAVAGW